ncbi:hypothetical protein [Agrobacterium cavarae]|uniref:hypothetical protein n=1 Tax=Agrobacterium cavarae TaxID=2528239 RepID=UPI003EE54DF2
MDSSSWQWMWAQIHARDQSKRNDARVLSREVKFFCFLSIVLFGAWAVDQLLITIQAWFG